MSNGAPQMLKPALIGGAVFGVLSGMPLVGALNCLCCALVIGAGFFAAYLYSKESKTFGAEFRPGNGATLGLITAPFYALAATITQGLASLVMPQPDPEQIREMMEQFGGDQMDPQMLDMITRFTEQSSGVMGLVFGFFFSLVVGAIFCTIGGLIGGSVFKVEAPPPPPPAPPAGMGPSAGAGPGGGAPPSPGV